MKDIVVVVDVVTLDLISIFSFPRSSRKVEQWDIKKLIMIDKCAYINVDFDSFITAILLQIDVVLCTHISWHMFGMSRLHKYNNADFL